MSIKDGPSQPAPVIVNPQSSATGQASFNKDAALQQRALNMVNQYTPEGSTVYEATGEEVQGIPTMKVTQSLSPEQQGLYDTSTRLAQQYGDIGERQLGQVDERLSTPFTLDAFGQAPTINEDIRRQTSEAMLARVQPQMDRDRQSLETQLRNQGFVTGSEAYNTSMDERNRALNDMTLAADVAGGNEMARMFGLESSARDRAINEAIMERNQPMTELAAFMSGSTPSSPQFLSTPQGQIAAPDLMGAQYMSAKAQNQANQNVFNQQMGSYNADLEGMYGLGAAGATAAGYAWSDRRLKKNIRKVGKISNGLNVYSYQYLWSAEPQIGLMADEVKQLHPEAVKNFAGFDAVDYNKAVL